MAQLTVTHNLFAVQENQQDEQPDKYACHSRQCTKFCKLTWYWKVTNTSCCQTCKKSKTKKLITHFALM